MIKKLIIENFRSYQKVEFNFIKGVNCIIGLPDSGKTNVIRALKWALTNRPLGKRMLSNFNNDYASVSIETADGDIVTLRKDKKSAVYKLNGTELNAIGSDVPDVVIETANIGELNFQRQLDKPFLICESPGEIAKIFNKITRLEKPDKAISTLTTDINSENKTLKQLKIDEAEIRSEIKLLGNTEEMSTEFRAIETENENLEDVIEKRDELCALLDKIEESEKIKNNIGSILAEMKNNLNGILKCEKKLEEIESEHEKLSDHIDTIIQMKNDIEESRKEFMDAAKQYRKFLDTIKICPFCDKCKAPISAHNLDEAIKGIL